MFKRKPIHIHFNSPIVNMTIEVVAESPNELKDALLAEVELSVKRAFKMSLGDVCSVIENTPEKSNVSQQL